MITINTSLPLPVSEELANSLAKLLNEPEGYAYTINFKDEGYDAETGGFRPVEIRLEYRAQEWHISYITEFCYVGIGPYAELVKSLDFDFGCGTFQTEHGYFAIETGSDMYTVWEANFLSYWKGMNAYKVAIAPG